LSSHLPLIPNFDLKIGTKFSFRELVSRLEKILTGEFNEKLFREQLAYFEDIDYSEKVDFMKGFEKDDEEIKKELIEFSLTR